MSTLSHVGNDDFASEVIGSDLPVVVDFYAAWCPPCKMLAPVLDSVAQKFAGRVKIVKCDTDRDAAISESFGVGKIPNVMFFKDGEVLAQHIGFINEADLSRRIEEMLL